MKLAGVARAVTVLALAVPGMAGAQDSSKPGSVSMRSFTAERPRLGVTVDIRPRETDSIGAFVETVQPGSPAYRAGIRAADIITRFAGHSISSATDQRPAGIRLISFVTQLDPSSTVPVELRRGSARKNVSISFIGDVSLVFKGSGKESAGQWTFSITPTDSGAGANRSLMVQMVSPLATLETAPLNSQLGQYFGTSEGVLVINNGARDRLPLLGGDVILAVDGRKPNDPNHLMQLLQAKKTSIQLDVLRHGKRRIISFQP